MTRARSRSPAVRSLLVLLPALAVCACAAVWPRGRGAKDAKPSAAPAASGPAATAPTSQPSGARLSVTIKDLRNRKGVLIFGVFRTGEGFPTDESKAVFWEVRDAAGEDLTFTTRLPPGRYGASVLHDENRSGNMDRGIAGIPLEGYGVTNNPKPRFRAATFKEATFELPEQGAAMSISVQYF